MTDLAGPGLEQEIKALIIDALMIEDLAPEDIVSEDPLFGEGLGLDSIDALEMAIALENRYGIQVEEDSEDNVRIFASVRSLSEFVTENRTK